MIYYFIWFNSSLQLSLVTCDVDARDLSFDSRLASCPDVGQIADQELFDFS